MMDITQKYNRESFVSFLRDNFLPDDFDSNRENVYKPQKNTVITNAVKLGVCPSLDISIYEFKHQSRNDPRVTLSRESFGILKNNDMVSNALAVFYNEDSSQWRLSLITSDYSINENNKRAERTFSNPRRYSYLLGEGCKRHTPESVLFTKGKIKSIDDLVSRFAIDVVTKKFYSELFNWYDAFAMPLVKFPEGIGAKVTLTQTDNNVHLIRLITRLIFVWFIKQKDLIPSWIFEKEDVAEVLNDFDPCSNKKGNYYNGILQNLFFATLNKAIPERKFADDGDGSKHYGIKTLYRDHTDNPMFAISKQEFIKKFEKVPFLNGGLFECLDRREGDDRQIYHDGFSRESKQSAFVPNCLFWGNKDGAREGIIDLFNRYNFTVEENTPQDVDIALDPELLGKVFENLLGTFNPETKETARNGSGSFYTPREIVDYMVDTSLKAYLKDKLEKGTSTNDIEGKIDHLFSYNENGHDFTDGQIKTIIEAIDTCKILDPACGSGAFPMGILHKLTFTLGKLDPDNTQWRNIQHKNALTQMDKALSIPDKSERQQRLKEIDDIFESESNLDDYGRKLYIIENCLFGIDIQPIAIQITKLRFFISLIVDQKPKGDINNNYGIIPLPNLETKFVAANTLIGVTKKDDAMALFEDTAVEKLQAELLEIRHKHFSARTAGQKTALREKDKTICAKLAKLLEEQHFYTNKDAIQMADWDPYNQNKHAEFFDSYWMFGIKDGFDVVIGNPPYVSTRNGFDEKIKEYYKNNYKLATGQFDLFVLFIEKVKAILNNRGIVSFITPKKLLTNENFQTLRIFLLEHLFITTYLDAQMPFETAAVEANVFVASTKESNTIKTYMYNGINSIHKYDIDKRLIDLMPFKIFPFSVNPINIEIIYKVLKNSSTTLGRFFSITRGFECGFNHSSISRNKGKYKIIKGEHITRYYIKDSDWFVTPDFSCKKIFKTQEIFAATPKLVTKFVSNSLEFALDEYGYYNTNVVYNIHPLNRENTDLKYFMALCNSKLIDFWFFNTYINDDKLFPHIQKNQLDSIPVPPMPEIHRIEKMVNITNKILAAKADAPQADTSALEAQIDKMVYELYGLSEDEIKIVEGKK